MNRKPNIDLSPLSHEEETILRAFADEEGDAWKDRLSTYWITGRYPDHCIGYAGLLQRLRNRRGPRWLAVYEFPEVEAAIYEREDAALRAGYGRLE